MSALRRSVGGGLLGTIETGWAGDRESREEYEMGEKLDKAKGTIKENVGEATDNEDLEREGKMDRKGRDQGEGRRRGRHGEGKAPRLTGLEPGQRGGR